MCLLTPLLFLVFLTITSASTILVQHEIPVIVNYCRNASILVKSEIGPRNVSDEEFEIFAQDVIKSNLGIFQVVTNNRFLHDIKHSQGNFISRYGTCSVPFGEEFFSCLFNFHNGGSDAKIFYMYRGPDRTECMEDMSPRIVAHDRLTESNVVLNFGASCCIYNPIFVQTSDEDRWLNELPLYVSYFSWVVLITLIIVCLFLIIAKNFKQN